MREERKQRINYIVADYVSTNVAWFLFNLARYYFISSNVVGFSSLEYFLTSPMVLIGQFCVPVMMLCIYYLSGYYNKVFLKSRLQEFITTVSTAFAGTVVCYFMIVFNDNLPGRSFTYEMVLLLYALLFTVVYMCRLCITSTATHKIHNREWSFNTLIVGTSKNAELMEQRLREMRKSMGFKIVGYVETCEDAYHRELNLPVYDLKDLSDVCQTLNIKNLIVIPHRHGIKATMTLVNGLLPLDMPIYISPDMYQLLTTKVRLSNVVGEPLVDISRTDMSQSTLNMKRMFDVLLSSVALVVISPLLLAIAVAVKCTSAGPVIYRQRRIGYHKKPFDIYKFRSMKVDAEVGGPALSTLNDPRITNIGRFLRKYRLDELPQFWNVVKGDMSLVGPRPEREYYIKQIMARAPYYTLIHQVRPGITSWGMVKYGYASDVDGMIERLRYDLLYIENVSMLVDLKILFYTIQTVFTGKGI